MTIPFTGSMGWTTAPVPKVSGWSQAGSILSLIGGAIAKSSKDKKTQSIGRALAAVGSIPGAIHNPGLTDQEGIGKKVVKQSAPKVSWLDDPTNTNYGSLNLDPNTQFLPGPDVSWDVKNILTPN